MLSQMDSGDPGKPLRPISSFLNNIIILYHIHEIFISLKSQKSIYDNNYINI